MSMEVRDREGPPPPPLAEHIRKDGTEGASGVGRFVMRLIPRPPDVKHEIVRHAKDCSVAEEVSIRLGCPHCHEDIEFRWAIDDDHRIFDQLRDVLGEIRSLPFHLLAERLLGRDDETRRKLADVVERLYDKLRSSW